MYIQIYIQTIVLLILIIKLANIKESKNPFIPQNFKEDEVSKNYKVHDIGILNKNNFYFFKENKFSYNPFTGDIFRR